MTSSGNFSKWAAVLLLSGLPALTGCLHAQAGHMPDAPANARLPLIAVLPPANLSGTPAPLKELREMLVGQLHGNGFTLQDEEETLKFMARHRVRNTADIDSRTGRSFKEETGADAVLITSVVLYNEVYPPKISLWARLIRAGEEQTVLWIDGRGMAGDDRPGLLGLGLVRDPRRLLEKEVQSLVASLTTSLSGQATPSVSAARGYRPTTAFRSPLFDPGTHYRVAVVPFYDVSGRKNADTILSLQFTAALAQFRNFEVIEPGLVREKLLAFRMIMDHGVSVANAETLFDALDCDLILAGTVFRFEDFQGPQGAPAVELSVQLLERKSREIIWTSRSANTGDDNVYAFDIGKVNTAQALASKMAGSLLEQLTAP